jgi:rhamnulokinase
MVKLFGNLRDYAETPVIDVPGETVREVLSRLCEANRKLGEAIFEGDRLRSYIRVMIDGRDIELAQGLDTPVSEKEQIAIFPPIAGGSMARKTVLAVDLGAESGRVMAVHFDGAGLQLEELHRFSNGAVEVRETLYWDFLRLWSEIKAGITKGKVHNPSSIGLDTWGVDFGLLDKDGRLLGNPVCYRDNRTEGMMEAAFARVPKEQIFARTGIQFMRLNTLYQMMSLVESGSPLLKIADTFLTSPDLLNYWLTGEKACEYSNASTTQMLDARTGTWATDLLETLGIPTNIFPNIIPPGTKLGRYEGIPVIAPACHDTGSAVAAIPTETAAFGYISSGTWSLIGLETKQPYLGPDALAANVTNEGGVNGTVRLLSNVGGLWLVQQCRTTWRHAGQDYDYGTLVRMAKAAPALTAFIDLGAPEFLVPGDYPAFIRAFCDRTGQPVPESEGAIVRIVLESLALEYKAVFDRLAALTGNDIDVIHIVGGGTQNHLLNQMAANATGLPVIAGPIEATVIGNALVQLIALGELGNLQEARQVVAKSEGLMRYEPQETAVWEEAYQRSRKL